MILINYFYFNSVREVHNVYGIKMLFFDVLDETFTRLSEQSDCIYQ